MSDQLQEQSLQHLICLIHELKARNTQLVSTADKNKKEADQRERWSKAEINLLIQENTRHLEQQSKLESLVGKLTQKAIEREQVIQVMETKVLGFQTSIQEIHREYGGYFTQLSQYKNKVSQLHAKNEKLRGDIKQSNIRVQYLTKEVEYKRKQLNSQSVNRRSLSPRVGSRGRSQKGEGKQSHRRRYQQIKQEIETTIVTLDQMSALSESWEHTKEDLKKKYEDFQRIKEQCQATQLQYEQELHTLKQQNQDLERELKNNPNQNKGDQTYCLSVLKSCFQYGLAYILATKDQMTPETRWIAQRIEKLIQYFEQNEVMLEKARSEEITSFTQVNALKEELRMVHDRYNQETDKLCGEFSQLEEERNNLILSLTQEIHHKDNQISILKAEIQEMEEQKQLCNCPQFEPPQIGLELLRISDQNTSLKIKNFEAFGLLEALLHVFANALLDWEAKECLNKYYRVCEQSYWEIKPILARLQPEKTPPPSSRSKLRKAVIAVMFLSSLVVSRRRRQDSNSPTLSSLRQHYNHRRFLSLLSNHANFQQRLQNRRLQLFKTNQTNNIFEQLVVIVSTQLDNEMVKRLNRPQPGWSVFQSQLGSTIKSWRGHLDGQTPLRPVSYRDERMEESRPKSLVNTRSVGSFRRLKGC